MLPTFKSMIESMDVRATVIAVASCLGVALTFLGAVWRFTLTITTQLNAIERLSHAVDEVTKSERATVETQQSLIRVIVELRNQVDALRGKVIALEARSDLLLTQLFALSNSLQKLTEYRLPSQKPKPVDR